MNGFGNDKFFRRMRPSLDNLVKPLALLVVLQLLLVPKDCNKLAIPTIYILVVSVLSGVCENIFGIWVWIFETLYKFIFDVYISSQFDMFYSIFALITFGNIFALVLILCYAWKYFCLTILISSMMHRAKSNLFL